MARTYKDTPKKQMRPDMAKVLAKEGYSPIFASIDRSKRDLKRHGYTKGEITETLIDIFGNTDPKVSQRINQL